MALKQDRNYAEAEEVLHALIAKNENSELWFQLGLVQRFQKKNEEALQSQQQALKLLDSNHDARLELARLYYWKGNYNKALALLEKILEAHPDYTDAITLVNSVKRAQHPVQGANYLWQLDMGYENSSFSRRQQNDWHQHSLQLSRKIADDMMLFIRAENLERFDIHNEYYEVGMSYTVNHISNIGMSIGYAPDSLFIPKWRLKTEGTTRIVHDNNYINDSWITLHFQHDRYKNLNTTVVKPGIRYTLIKNWEIHAQHINVIDENDDHLVGWSTRIDWQTPSPKLRVFAGISDAPETENIITVDTEARFAGFSYQVMPQVTLHVAYAREDRENSFIRNIVSTALSVKF